MFSMLVIIIQQEESFIEESFREKTYREAPKNWGEK